MVSTATIKLLNLPSAGALTTACRKGDDGKDVEDERLRVGDTRALTRWGRIVVNTVVGNCGRGQPQMQ